MKKAFTVIGMALAVLTLGCSMEPVYFKNDAGETVKCEGNSDTVKECVKKYEESSGYKRFKMPEMEKPMGGTDY